MFDPGSTRTHLVTILLGALILLDLVSIGSTYTQIGLLTSVNAGQEIDYKETLANDQRQQMIGTLQTLVYLITAMAFLVWLHDACSNLRLLGARNLRYTPGWAVGSFFIPFMSLFWPYEAVKEVWQASDPNYPHESWQSAPSSALLRWWWLLFLLMNFIGYFVAIQAADARRPADFLSLSWVLISNDILQILAALLAMRVVRAINARQREKGQRPWHGLHEPVAPKLVSV